MPTSLKVSEARSTLNNIDDLLAVDPIIHVNRHKKRAFSIVSNGHFDSWEKIAAESQTKRVRIGVAAFIEREEKILVIQRRGAHGAGTWSIPGGAIEFGERPEDAVRREVYEEVGITGGEYYELRGFSSYIEHAVTPKVQWITLFFLASNTQNAAWICEPEKVSDMRWVGWDDVPAPTFEALGDYLRRTSVKRELRANAVEEVR